MKYGVAISTMALAVSLPAAQAFVPSKLVQQQQQRALSMTAFPEDETPFIPDDMKNKKEEEEKISRDPNMIPTQYGKKMSEAIPFLKCPPVLMQSDLAGNVGFDPLGFAKNRDQLWEYREAEIKHARLAMLAAIGWPVSELLDRDIAAYFKLPSMLDDGDRVPSVLNGGIGDVNPRFWGFCVGLCAAIDMYGVAMAKRGGPDYFPGNLGYDPLNFFPEEKLAQERLKLAEIKHGRTAMLGVAGYVIEEYITKMAVVDDTPLLFQPLTETVEEAVIGAMAVEEALEGAMMGSF